jgi:hypothetical protein
MPLQRITPTGTQINLTVPQIQTAEHILVEQPVNGMTLELLLHLYFSTFAK